MHSPVTHRLPFWLTPLFVIAGSISSPAQSSNIVISQIYGGGGNAGASYRNDFIELFNRGTTAVNVSGWTVHYASASGTSWDRTALQGTIAPGQYYLVSEA